jgi:SAM-dependent methyltransferase
MDWRVKAIVQNSVGILPPRLSYAIYFWLQNHMGSLRNDDLWGYLKTSLSVISFCKRNGICISNKMILEVGTGRTVNIPIFLWLGGAKGVKTVDLNPYLKESKILELLYFLNREEEHIKKAFQGLINMDLLDQRLNKLKNHEKNVRKLLKMMNIEYFSPASAASLPIENDTIDYHLSINVLEHIPHRDIKPIFLEGRRILKKDGKFIHFIDLSDHFSHSDKLISSINFLKYSEKQWHYWSGNRFMFHNRLRIDDFYLLFREIGLEIIDKEEAMDVDALALLESGFVVDNRFSSFPLQRLGITTLKILGAF